MAAESDELAYLREENARLRAELAAYAASEEAGRRRRGWALRTGGKLLLPLLDRRRVVRNFVRLFQVGSRYAGARDQWPAREEVVAAAEAFGVSLLSFVIRRRVFLLAFSLLALIMPIVQVWLVREQNRLVDLQNELVNIQADDIVARGISSENLLANELNGALLASRDVRALNRMLTRLFGAGLGEMMGGTDSPEARRLYLQGTAGRAHLLVALAEALRSPGGADPPGARELWRMMADPAHGAFAAVLGSSVNRLYVTLDTTRATLGDDVRLEAECQRYLLGLASTLRRGYALAAAADEKPAYFAMVAPLFARLAQLPPRDDRPLAATFSHTFQELLVDLALEPRFGEPEPPLPKDVDATLKAGFEALQKGVNKTATVRWDRLRALLGVAR